MEVRLGEPFKNALLGRTEVEFKINFSGASPKRDEIIKALSKKLNIKPELIVLRNTNSVYGSHLIKGKVHAYEDANKLREIEPKFIVKRYIRGEISGEEEKKGTKEGEEAKKEA
ncbi:hypothetical protein J7J26_03130 [Candidatus Micrarchaeota archaeon]|nr:hypothetical protein [Candidatus Micrarchaeota archaeon]